MHEDLRSARYNPALLDAADLSQAAKALYAICCTYRGAGYTVARAGRDVAEIAMGRTVYEGAVRELLARRLLEISPDGRVWQVHDDVPAEMIERPKLVACEHGRPPGMCRECETVKAAALHVRCSHGRPPASCPYCPGGSLYHLEAG